MGAPPRCHKSSPLSTPVRLDAKSKAILPFPSFRGSKLCVKNMRSGIPVVSPPKSMQSTASPFQVWFISLEIVMHALFDLCARARATPDADFINCSSEKPSVPAPSGSNTLKSGREREKERKREGLCVCVCVGCDFEQISLKFLLRMRLLLAATRIERHKCLHTHFWSQSNAPCRQPEEPTRSPFL